MGEKRGLREEKPEPVVSYMSTVIQFQTQCPQVLFLNGKLGMREGMYASKALTDTRLCDF